MSTEHQQYSTHNQSDKIREYAAQRGIEIVRSYVSKSADSDELVAAVRKVAAGENYLDRDLASVLAFTPAQSADPFSTLSNREVEIMRLLGEGKSLRQIAGTFGIAYKTVANSCSRLKTKLGLERTADLIRIALENQKK